MSRPAFSWDLCALRTDPWGQLGLGFVFALLWQRVLLPLCGEGPSLLVLFVCLAVWLAVSGVRRGFFIPEKSTLLLTCLVGATLGFGSVVPQMLLQTGGSAGPLGPLVWQGLVRAAVLACIATPLLCLAAERLCALCEKVAAPEQPFPRLAFFAASLVVLFPA